MGLGGNGLVGCIKSHSCVEMEMMSESLDPSAGEASQRPSAVVEIVCVPGRQCVSFHRSPTFLWLQQASHCTCFMNLWASVYMKGFRNNLSAYIQLGDPANRFQFWTTLSRSQTQRMNSTTPPFLCKCLAVMFHSGLGFSLHGLFVLSFWRWWSKRTL